MWEQHWIYLYKNIRVLFYFYCFIFTFVLVKDLLASQANDPNFHQDSCREYANGEERILSVPFVDIGAFPMSVFSMQCHYKIKRQTSQTYTASIALEFSPSLAYFNGPVPTDQVHKHYLQKVKNCIAKSNHKIIGVNGKQILIDIEDAKVARETNSSTPRHSIQIHTHYNIPSSFKSFNAYIGCPSIFHEILHYFCLGDEYSFHLSNFFRLASQYTEDRLLFDCRVTQTNSIMSDSIRWSMVLDDPLDHGFQWRSPLHREEPTFFNEDIEYSLLDPTHFNAILYGNCSSRDDVRHYRECMRLAFQDSSLNFNCLSQKHQCENLNLLGRDKNKELARLYTESYLLQLDLGRTNEDLVENLFKRFSYDPSNHDLSIFQYGYIAYDHGYLLYLKEGYEKEIEELNRRIHNVQNWPDE